MRIRRLDLKLYSQLELAWRCLTPLATSNCRRPQSSMARAGAISKKKKGAPKMFSRFFHGKSRKLGTHELSVKKLTLDWKRVELAEVYKEHQAAVV